MLRRCLALLLAATSSAAAFTPQIAFQGRLEDPPGTPMSGAVTVTVELWDAETGGSKLFEETDLVTMGAGGLFLTTLGDDVALSEDLLDADTWAAVVVGGGPLGPRLPLIPAPQALVATKALVAGTAVTASQAATLVPTATLDLAGQRLGNLGDPQDPQDAATLSVVTSEVASVATQVGSLASLTVTPAADLVAAVNVLDAEVGDLGGLATTAQASLVEAINEVEGGVSLRTVLVKADGTPSENGEALAAAMSAASPSAGDPLRLQLEAGTYEVSSSLVLKPFLHLIGAGRKATTVAFAGVGIAPSGVIEGIDEASLRDLAIEHTGTGDVIGLHLATNDRTHVERVDVRIAANAAGGLCHGIYLSGNGGQGVLRDIHLDIECSGAAARGIFFGNTQGAQVFGLRGEVRSSDNAATGIYHLTGSSDTLVTDFDLQVMASTIARGIFQTGSTLTMRRGSFEVEGGATSGSQIAWVDGSPTSSELTLSEVSGRLRSPDDGEAFRVRRVATVRVQGGLFEVESTGAGGTGIQAALLELDAAARLELDGCRLEVDGTAGTAAARGVQAAVGMLRLRDVDGAVRGNAPQGIVLNSQGRLDLKGGTWHVEGSTSGDFAFGLLSQATEGPVRAVGASIVVSTTGANATLGVSMDNQAELRQLDLEVRSSGPAIGLNFNGGDFEISDLDLRVEALQEAQGLAVQHSQVDFRRGTLLVEGGGTGGSLLATIDESLGASAVELVGVTGKLDGPEGSGFFLVRNASTLEIFGGEYRAVNTGSSTPFRGAVLEGDAAAFLRLQSCRFAIDATAGGEGAQVLDVRQGRAEFRDVEAAIQGSSVVGIETEAGGELDLDGGSLEIVTSTATGLIQGILHNGATPLVARSTRISLEVTGSSQIAYGVDIGFSSSAELRGLDVTVDAPSTLGYGIHLRGTEALVEGCTVETRGTESVAYRSSADTLRIQNSVGRVTGTSSGLSARGLEIAGEAVVVGRGLRLDVDGAGEAFGVRSVESIGVGATTQLADVRVEVSAEMEAYGAYLRDQEHRWEDVTLRAESATSTSYGIDLDHASTTLVLVGGRVHAVSQAQNLDTRGVYMGNGGALEAAGVWFQAQADDATAIEVQGTVSSLALDSCQLLAVGENDSQAFGLDLSGSAHLVEVRNSRLAAVQGSGGVGSTFGLRSLNSSGNDVFVANSTIEGSTNTVIAGGPFIRMSSCRLIGGTATVNVQCFACVDEVNANPGLTTCP